MIIYSWIGLALVIKNSKTFLYSMLKIVPNNSFYNFNELVIIKQRVFSSHSPNRESGTSDLIKSLTLIDETPPELFTAAMANCNQSPLATYSIVSF